MRWTSRSICMVYRPAACSRSGGVPASPAGSWGGDPLQFGGRSAPQDLGDEVTRRKALSQLRQTRRLRDARPCRRSAAPGESLSSLAECMSRIALAHFAAQALRRPGMPHRLPKSPGGIAGGIQRTGGRLRRASRWTRNNHPLQDVGDHAQRVAGGADVDGPDGGIEGDPLHADLDASRISAIGGSHAGDRGLLPCGPRRCISVSGGAGRSDRL